MALDSRYFTSFSLEEFFVDHSSGEPLAGGLIYFYRDTARNTAKPVYELSGFPPSYTYTVLPDPITLSATGNPVNGSGDPVSIYYYPYDDNGNLDLYYIIVTDANNVFQFDREAWPNVTASTPSDVNSLPVQNQLSNVQFASVFANSGNAVTFTQASGTHTYNYAPGWDFVLTGAGSVTVTQVPVSGSNLIPSSPPFYLKVQTTGLTSTRLQQTLSTNSGLWTSTAFDPIFLSASVTLQNELNSPAAINIYYEASSGSSFTTPILILGENLAPTAPWAAYQGSTANSIPTSDDTNAGTAGFVNIYVSFPSNSTVDITNLQVVPTLDANSAAEIVFNPNPTLFNTALSGGYYIPRLSFKPIPSLLTAWDFPLNPQQFAPPATLTTGLQYIWDQTIATTSSGAHTFTTNALTGELKFHPVSNNQAISVMQYLSGDQALALCNSRLACNVFAYDGAGGGKVQCQVFLVAPTGAATIPAAMANLGTLSSTGGFTATAANWTVVLQSGPPALATLPTAPSTDGSLDMQFNGWAFSSAQNANAGLFAIVVTFAWDTATDFNINSISLVKGDIPSRPAAQTVDQVLRECQLYFETSYAPGIVIGTANATGPLLSRQGSDVDTDGTHLEIATRSFGFSYFTKKRTTPTTTLYSAITTNTSANVTYYFYYNGSIQAGYPADKPLSSGAIIWTQTSNGPSGVYYRSASTAVIAHPNNVQNGTGETFITWHYSADARLGLV